MRKWKKYIKREMDVEFFACVHGMSLVFVYGAELYFAGEKNIPFTVIFQIFVLGYIISWFQKLLFLKEKIYTGFDKKARVCLWCIAPNIFAWIAAQISESLFRINWYQSAPVWVEPVFYLIMLCYYVMLWVALQIMYKDESEELNEILLQYKAKHHDL